MARSRRRNGKDIVFGRLPRVASLPARSLGGEIEAISASLRDLIDFVHGCVGKTWNIFICLRLASSPRTKSLQTSTVQSPGHDPPSAVVPAAPCPTWVKTTLQLQHSLSRNRPVAGQTRTTRPRPTGAAAPPPTN